MAGTERLIDTLKSRGIRVTPQRAIILAIIEQMPAMSLSKRSTTACSG